MHDNVYLQMFVPVLEGLDPKGIVFLSSRWFRVCLSATVLKSFQYPAHFLTFFPVIFLIWKGDLLDVDTKGFAGRPRRIVMRRASLEVSAVNNSCSWKRLCGFYADVIEKERKICSIFPGFFFLCRKWEKLCNKVFSVTPLLSTVFAPRVSCAYLW